MRRWFIGSVLFLALLVSFIPVSAHAFPVRIEPPLNIALDQAPPQIQIWFSEPVEPQFSKLLLRDSNGNILETAPSYVSPSDPTSLVMSPGTLPDGIYTIVWRALSIADGHATLGSFPIVIGEASGAFASITDTSDVLAPDGALVLASNLLSLALGIGGLGFLLFVWRLAVPDKYPEAERRMMTLIWIGWVFIGVTGFLLLLLQYQRATGTLFLSGINGDSLNGLVANTRFGHLWLARMALWAGLGGALWFGLTDSWFNWIALVIGGGILAINSVFSHADAANDQLASVAADGLHLASMVLWVGGLFQFINVMLLIRHRPNDSTVTLSKLVGHFSNFARVSVAALSVTGFYLAWLDIGSIDGLLTTVYGQALLVKMILFAPVLGIAAINLVYTHRGLARGEAIWAGRLRKLVSAEITLTIGMLLAVGVMTSSYPTRFLLDQRAANPPPAQPQPFTATQTANDLSVQLTFSPGWIGTNDFTLKLTDSAGKPVNDATLVRVKFQSQAQNLGESELRPTLTGDGVYTISGTNLSVPGEWRIRVTIQRPNVFDTLVDFTPQVPAIPEPPEAVPAPSPDAPLPNRLIILLLVGVAAMAVGGFFLGENRSRPFRASTLLSIGLLGVGVMFLLTAMQGSATPAVNASASIETYTPTGDAPVRLAVAPSSDGLPYLITNDGKLLQPGSDKQWHAMPLDAKVRDVDVDVQNTIWAATDSGLYVYKDGQWSQDSTDPVSRVVMMHGYVFALGDDGDLTRAPAGGIELDRVRDLKIPSDDQAANDMVMLGNHSHVVQSGDQLYLTGDLGLSWTPLDATQAIDAISVDTDGNLLAAGTTGLETWNFVGTTWSNPVSLPGGDPHPVLRTFNNHLYALGGGKLYLQVGNKWDAISLPDSEGAFLYSLEFQYPRVLWALDAKSPRLWSSEDGKQWTETKIVVS